MLLPKQDLITTENNINTENTQEWETIIYFGLFRTFLLNCEYGLGVVRVNNCFQHYLFIV